MNKTAVAIVAILAIAALTGLYIWSSYNRYYIIKEAQGIAYEVDRKTGESWMLYGGGKIPLQEAVKSQQKEQELPYPETSKITGNARLGYGYFSGKLYNGSDWKVNRVIFSVSAIEKNGTVRWSRDFSETVMIDPLKTSSFTVSVSGDEGVGDTQWTIKKVFGYKE